MTYQQERDQALIELGRAGFTVRDARRLLALGTTLQRLAEAQCNGDYPYNGDRDDYLHGETREARAAWRAKWYRTCPECGQLCGRIRLVKGVCPDCRAAELVRAVLAEGPRMCWQGHNFHVETDSVTHARLCCDKPAWVARFSGDPRGCVLWIYPAGTPAEAISDGSARSTGIAIVGRY